jgi:hypothetical protein
MAVAASPRSIARRDMVAVVCLAYASSVSLFLPVMFIRHLFLNAGAARD